MVFYFLLACCFFLGLSALLGQGFLLGHILCSFLFFLLKLDLFNVPFAFQVHTPIEFSVDLDAASFAVEFFPLFQRNGLTLREMFLLLEGMTKAVLPH